MKKSVKITLWVLGSLVVFAILVFLSADIIASRIVKKEVAKTFAHMPDADASVGGIYLNLLSGSAVVKDINFTTHSLSLEDSVSGTREPGMAVHVPTLTVWNIHYWELFRHRRLIIRHVSLDEAQLLVYMDEQHPETLMPTFPKDSTLAKANNWLQSVEVHSFDLNRFCARLHSTRTPLCVAVDSLSLQTRGWAYHFSDSSLAYNDSVYSLQLGSFGLNTPDGFFALEAHDLLTENQGPFELGYTRLYNVFTPQQMADLRHEPIDWIDMSLNTLTTSAFNPIRKVLAEDYTLDSIRVDVKRLYVCHDERYKPKRPYQTPQDFLRRLPVTFSLGYLEANTRCVDVEMATTRINCGRLNLRNIRARLSHLTNARGAVWHCRLNAPFGKQGKIEAALDMHLNQAASFEVKMDAKDVETADLNPFIRPLIGITSQCRIDHLDASYQGDRHMAKGQFCMQYHGLSVKVHKEDKIPYEVVTKYANTFTQLANTLVPKSNPTSVDPAPRRYAVEWQRDEWKSYPLYLLGPCIDGVKKTMLPGLYVHKQIK